MKLQLPADTAEFAQVLRRHATALADVGVEQRFRALDDMGVLDLLTEDSPDPLNKELTTVVALEELATAGLTGPLAETLWARARSSEARASGAFVAAPTRTTAAGRVLVPHAAGAAAQLAIARGDGTVAVAPLTDVVAADIKVEKGHGWVAVPDGTPSFEDVAAPYLWRTAAALTLGWSEAALAMALEHVKARTQFKRPLSAFQVVQFRLAESRWRLAGLQLLVREAAWRADRADRRADAVSALAWLHARQVGRVVAAHSHQLFGAIGFTDELGLTRVTGPSTFLRTAVPAGPAAETVWKARAPIGAQPPSTVLGGFSVA